MDYNNVNNDGHSYAPDNQSGYDNNEYQQPVYYTDSVYDNGYAQGNAAYPQEPSPRNQKSGGLKVFLIAFAGALLACGIAFGLFFIFNGSSSGSTTLGATVSTSVNSTDTDPSLAEQVAAKALPSIASIDVYTSSSSSSVYGYGSSSSSGELTESSLGSGVVLSTDGYIITNNHVVEGADALKVTVGGAEYSAKLVGGDSSSDIAVLKIEGASDLTPIELGDSDKLAAGQWVMSLGSPFGLEQSVATGVVSATSRSQIVEDTNSAGQTTGYTIYPNMIQTDAAINPGNSGGALVDANGSLIGINTMITSYSGNYSGVGFAIPSNYAVSIAQQLIEGKTPTYAQLGVSLANVTSQVAKSYNLSVDYGAYVTKVYSGSAAESAGIQTGDVIIAFEGEKVESASDLMIDVRAKNPGDKVKLTIMRGNSEKEVEVTLGSGQSSTSSNSQNSGSSGSLGNLFGGN